MKKIISLIVALLLVSSFTLAADAEAQAQIVDAPMDTEGKGTAHELAVESDSDLELTEAEIEGLKLMREEEMLARDVYNALYAKWELNIFSNIAKSEQTHTDAVLRLMEAYGVEDIALAEEGKFVNSDLQAIYDALVSQGAESLLEGLVVGATVEDLDIKDLMDLLENTVNPDVKMVYENLLKGSRNHIRAFSKQIEMNDGSYEAQYVSEDVLAEVLGMENERGPLLDEDSSFVPGFEEQFQRRGTKQAAGTQQLRDGTATQQQLRDGTGTQQQLKSGASFREEAGKRMIQAGEQKAGCDICEQDGEMLRAKLSNGRNAEVKVMPDRASETALNRLRLKQCDEGCTVELKEVSVGGEAKAAYRVKTERSAKLFGIFGTKMQVEADVDAETGEVLRVGKPWWAFLASEPEE